MKSKFKVGDKVIFKKYKDVPDWKLQMFEIENVIFELKEEGLPFYNNVQYTIRFKTKTKDDNIIYISSNQYYFEHELTSLKEERKEKMRKINST